MTPSWLDWGANTNISDFGPLGIDMTPLQKGRCPTFATTINNFVDIIHSTESKAIQKKVGRP